MTLLFAHVSWFETVDGPIQMANARQLLLVLGIVVIGLIIFTILQRLLFGTEKRLANRLQALTRYAPLLVRITTGMALVIFALRGEFLAPHNAPSSLELVTGLFLVLEFVIGVMLIVGSYIRSAAIGLVILWALQVFTSPVMSLIGNLSYIGAAIFLYQLGAGTYSFDGWLDRNPTPPRRWQLLAINTLQFTLGTSLLALAFSEKIFNITIAQQFINDYHWNFLSRLHVSDINFILFIGASEALFGILLIFNVSARLVSLLVLLTMLVTASLLGPTEVIGHLFAFGFVGAIWILQEPHIWSWRPTTVIKK